MKIMPVYLRYDYGVKSRGDSLEYRGSFAALQRIADEVYPFWYDDYLPERRDELQREVIEFADRIRPDAILFVIMNDEFTFKTLDILKSRYTTVNWFADDKYRFDSFTVNYAPYFTYSVTTDKYSVDKYKSKGYENVILSQWAAFETEVIPDFGTVRYKYDVTFVGMRSAYRSWILRRMAGAGITVECFGHGWGNGRVGFDKVKEIFKTSRINLNISNSVSYDVRYIIGGIRNLREFVQSKKRFEDIKARNFEIPALGGFQLSNYVPGIESYFAIGKEIAVYSSPEDMIQQIRYYLNNERERMAITQAGYQKALRNGTYLERFREIFAKIGLLKDI